MKKNKKTNIHNVVVSINVEIIVLQLFNTLWTSNRINCEV